MIIMSKYIEFETRFIDLDEKEVLGKLNKIGAEKTGDFYFREWIFQYKEWIGQNRRIRVRTDGTKNWLTYKANKTWEVDSTEEVELEVSSSDDMVKFLHSIDMPLLRYQEKKITRYERDDILFEINHWPKIPMVLEIESSSEEKVREGVKLLNLNWKDAIFEDQKVVHQKYYNVDLDTTSNYRFEN